MDKLKQNNSFLFPFKIKITLIFFLVFLIYQQVFPQSSDSLIIRYTHPAHQSMKSRFVKGVARVFLPKNSLIHKLNQKDFVSYPAPLPKKIKRDFKVENDFICGRSVYSISPLNKKPSQCVLFLHGGAYVNNIFKQHYIFAAKIVSQTGCKMIIPDYPLAPLNIYSDAFVMLDTLYKRLLSKNPSDSIIFMGDSAGGGLALAFAQYLSSQNVLLPAQLILICPWLDVSMTNPEISKIGKKDPILRTPGLIMAGIEWAGSNETSNYMISPINGTTKDVPLVSIFSGTHDLLYADCEKYAARMQENHTAVHLYVYPAMFHDWILFPNLREANFALEQVMSLISHKPLFSCEKPNKP